MIRLKEQLTGQSPNVVRLTLKVGIQVWLGIHLNSGLMTEDESSRGMDGIKSAGFSHKGCNLPSTDVPNFSSESRNMAAPAYL